MSSQSHRSKLHPDFVRNTILSFALCLVVIWTAYLVKAGAMGSGWHLPKVLLFCVLAALAVVLWWVIRIIAQDMMHLSRRDIQAALPILIGLIFSTFYCLRESKNEILLLAGAFFTVLLVTQLAASCHDYLQESPAAALVVSFCFGMLVLGVSWVRFHLVPPFYLQIVVLILILAAYEYIRRECLDASLKNKKSSKSDPSAQPDGDSWGEKTIVLVTDFMTRTFDMGVSVNLAVFWAFFTFYISTFYTHNSTEELVDTLTTFYDLGIQIQAILLGLVGAFGILSLQQMEGNRKKVLGEALQGFIGLNIFALMIHITGLLLRWGVDFDLIQRPLETATPWTTSCLAAILLFEAAWLLIPPSLLYLHSLVLVFIRAK
jgi:hypothetical protein